MEWYRLEVSPTAFTGDTDQPEQLIRQKGKKAGSCTYTLTPATDYLPHDTVLTYQVPEAGIYLLKLIPEGDKKGISYTSLFVSPYQLVAMPVNSHTFEVTAVDRLNGSPIPYAEIVTYTRESGQFVQEQVYPTDAEGKVLIPLAATRSGYRPLKYVHYVLRAMILWLSGHLPFMVETSTKMKIQDGNNGSLCFPTVLYIGRNRFYVFRELFTGN